MRTDTISVELRADMAHRLGLKPESDEDSKRAFLAGHSNASKLDRFLSSAWGANAENFPMRSERQWRLILEAAMPKHGISEQSDSWNVSRLATDAHCIAEETLVGPESRIDVDADVSSIADLSSAEHLAVTLAVNHFWQPSHEPLDFREILSKISGLPRDRVFSDDQDIAS